MKPGVFSNFILLSAAGGSMAFQVATTQGRNKVLMAPPLSMGGFFDFKPIHGSGSASENDLDEQWRLQQEKLAARRDHLDKSHLKAKYHGGEGVFEVHAKSATKSHVDDMYVMGEDDDNIVHEKKNKKPAFAFKFPWDK